MFQLSRFLTLFFLTESSLSIAITLYALNQQYPTPILTMATPHKIYKQQW